MASAVKVYLRTRPTDNVQGSFTLQPDGKSVAIQVKKTDKPRGTGHINNTADTIKFRFDDILLDASQETIFGTCAADVCDNVLTGYNGTIFAYGQTGAGKTYTMSGDVSAAYNQRGIVPRAIHHLFHESELRGDKEIEVRVSHLEIYNDVMYDLLADDVTQADNLQIVDRIDDPRFPETFAAGTGARETVIKGLTKKYCANEAEALAYFFAGEANRATASHILNKTSSRSHCIFTVYLESRGVGDSSEKTTVAKLNLVDLAGSERVKKTSVSGQQLKEANFINRSLTFLEQTVNALARFGQDNVDPHVSARQSKLTHILRDSLGGNCRTTLIACLWPDVEHADETVSTCRFASRVMTLQTKAVVNESKDPRVIIRKHERQIRELKQELAMHDTFAGKAPVNYGEMGEVERQELRQQVGMFLDGDMPVDDLPCESLKQVREIFRILKHSYRGAKTELEDALAKGPADTAVAAGADAAEEGDAEGEVGDMDAEGSTFNVGVAPPDFVPPPETPAATAPLPSAGATGAAETMRVGFKGTDAKAKAAAYEGYKAKVAPEKAGELAGMLADLRAKKRELREAIATCNAAKAEIDAVAKQLEETRLAAARGAEEGAEEGAEVPTKPPPPGDVDVIDQETYDAMARAKQRKGDYRRAFEEVKSLKTAVTEMSDEVQQFRAVFVNEFQAWYDKGGGAEFRLEDEEEDELDYGEKFDHLEMQLHLRDDPESGAYFQSKKLMRSGKTRPGVDKSAMSTMRMRVSGGTLKGGSKKEWDPRDTAPRPR
ncbi:kinesin-like protein KLP1 [Micromonas commoda]|uniref:Kinesin-like protein n=1 Tax=Micromonas commoda (strain RCC299 / NOUM17 / CCMP2709) TaxID=296587 RepID=C1E5J1_MICCC|nr:kinesin-like protein KLP1 [Micromonas commoda]ACO63266.1 kinesin-like protein KLP1 [Micromonas commoda]|eukprot:XP_002502008.1 kinesin-like protein KLP1 [Micromonas commoda]